MSQNFRIALWIPADRVNAGEAVIAQATANSGELVQTSFSPAGAGGGAGGTTPGISISTTTPAKPKVGDVWVDITNPAAPQVKVFRQGNAWVVMADASVKMPNATQTGELLVSGTGPNFNWLPEQGLIEGVY